MLLSGRSAQKRKSWCASDLSWLSITFLRSAVPKTAPVSAKKITLNDVLHQKLSEGEVIVGIACSRQTKPLISTFLEDKSAKLGRFLRRWGNLPTQKMRRQSKLRIWVWLLQNMELEAVKKERAQLMASLAQIKMDSGKAGGEMQAEDVRRLRRELELKKEKLNELRQVRKSESFLLLLGVPMKA